MLLEKVLHRDRDLLNRIILVEEVLQIIPILIRILIRILIPVAVPMLILILVFEKLYLKIQIT
jgi:hypothetical protein